MASPRFAWGIDVGNRALKAIKLVRADGGLKIDDFEVIEHENVLSNAGDNKEALIQSALANFVQRHSVKGGVAAVSVSGVSSFARFIKLPPVEPKKIPEIVKFEAIQQIPFPLEDVEWSYQLFQTPESPDVEVGIFAMKRELIDAHLKHFTDVDLNVQVVQMNPLAVYNAMYFDNRLSGTTMIIDLGAENTDLIIADGETIWLRSIPIGGNNFTEVLVKSFKLPFGKAEELKRNANTSKYARQIFQAMRPIFADLVAEIQRSIGFYSSVHRESRIKKILALGGTFRLAGLQKYLQQNLQLEVEKLNELSSGAPGDAKLAATFNQNLLSLVSAYGLAIQAMGQSKITSSLLPQAIRREKMWRDKTKWFGATAATLLLGAGLAAGGYYMKELQFKNNQGVMGDNNDAVAAASSLDKQWDDVQSKGANDRTTIQNVDSMLDYRTLWSNLVGDLFSALPAAPAGYPSPDYLKANARETRPIVLLNSMTSSYFGDPTGIAPTVYTDLGIAAPVASGGDTSGAAPATNTDIPAGSRGFIVTLSVTTPHANGYLYVLNSVIPKLQKFNRAWLDGWNAANPNDKRNYYFAKVSAPIGQTQIKNDSARVTLLQNSHSAAVALSGPPAGGGAPAPVPGGFGGPGFAPPGPPPMGRFGGFGGPPGPHGFGSGFGQPPQFGGAMGGQVTGASDPEVMKDRLTGEDRGNDWEMKIEIVVIVDPPPAAPGQTPGATPSAAAQ
jgi:type IV pilus assembly protein PilM